MKYYLSTNSWNLLESFVTESISPFSFYGKRNFGNNLSRHMGSSMDKINYLILTEKDQGGDFTVIFDEALIDAASLQRIKGLKGSYTYCKTIFYQKGLVEFRFDNEEIMENLVAETKILFEVKCLEKYSSNFYVSSIKQKAAKKTIVKLGESFSFEMEKNIENDNKFNAIKGALIGYARGAMSMSSPDMEKLIILLNDMKNSFAGLNTQIMTGTSCIVNSDKYIDKIDLCKSLYERTVAEKTNLFDVLKHHFRSILSMVSVRTNQLSSCYVACDDDLFKRLTREKRKIESEMMEIELDYDVLKLKEELVQIKAEEVKRGKELGKKRCYFKKGSPEYKRKNEIKDRLKSFEDDNFEYKQLKSALMEVNQNMKSTQPKSTGMDETITSTFGRISDIMLDLKEKVVTASIQDSINIDNLQYSVDKGMFFTDTETPELVFYTIFLNQILERNYKEPISETSILKLIENSCNEFKMTEYHNTQKGMLIIECLRDYWKYKNMMSMEFSIPEDMPIIQAIMAFLIKPFGYDQIERYMLNKKFQMKSFAYMLWGASHGYADLPKTFTDAIYENENVSVMVDKKLTSISNIIIG